MALFSDTLHDFKTATLRGGPGFFRVGQTHSGQWWLLDPEGRPFFARAVHGVQARVEALHDPAARLRAWGFNTLGGGSDRLYFEEGLAFLTAVDFCTGDGLIQLGGVRLPDVFAAEWPERAHARAAEVCPPLAEQRELIGWLTDDQPRWPLAPAAARPGLLQTCLSLEPSLAAYHAAWEFALALHGGRLETLAKAWGVVLPNKAALRELTRSEQGILSRGHLRDDARWAQEFARRYFGPATAAIRAHDPNHLVLGCRWQGPAGAALRAACLPPLVDVRLLDFTELADEPAVAAGPALVVDFSWVTEEFYGAPPGRRMRGLTAVERMLRRGRLALGRAVAQPAVVGYAWSHWADRAGEQPPFASGLVHGNDAEAREHTELLTEINQRVEELRSVATVIMDEIA
ncbi:MAG: hypothetical protein KA257_11720 [Opitutaceae bacterium]|nr:hypothetical protein [Opitutaceae bacterium]MBP9914364.1 hypothetical protein [Opitutaceae bacterium]